MSFTVRSYMIRSVVNGSFHLPFTVSDSRKDVLQMIDIMDLHTHTIDSGHACNSFYEMARSASQKWLTLFGSTDHAPMMPGTFHEYCFLNFKVIPRTLFNIKILMGAELLPFIPNPEAYV